MNRRIKSNILLALIALFLFSCSQYHTIVIENKQPPKVKVPNEIQSLILMNRSMTKDFHNFNEDSLQIYFYRKEFDVKKYVLDSLASDTCLQAIGDLLFESGRFDIVIPTERNINRDLDYYRIEQPLDWEYVDSICKTYNTDGLLVMEKYVNRVNSSFEAEVDQVYPDGKAKFSYFYATYDVMYDSFFRLYYPAKKEIIGQFFINDTIFWENGDTDQRTLFKNLGSIKKGLIDAGIKVALDLDDYLSPSWTPDSRGIFTIDKKNTTEQDLIAKADWTALAKYWLPLTESDDKKLRSKAEYNMALACELEGNIDEAIQWATKSYQSAFRNQTDIYLKKLKQRKADLLKIEKNIK